MSDKQSNTNDQISQFEAKEVDASQDSGLSSELEVNLSDSNDDKGSLGIYLKNLRVGQNISAKQLSIETKINESVLIKLENEEFDQLPRKIYLIGFIKSYTDYFKKDSAQALDLLDKVFEQARPITDVKGRFENHSGSNLNTNTIYKILAVLFITILLILLLKRLFFTSQVEVISSEITTEKIDSTTPLVGSPSNIELSQESTELKTPKTTKDAALTVEKHEEQKELKQKEGDQLPTQITFKSFPKNYLIYKSTKIGEIRDILPKGILAPNPNVSQKIIISARKDKTWIAYQKDDSEVKQLILKEGKVLVISGDEIRIVLGNSNLIRLIHNQKEVNIKSKTGIKSLVFPVQSATKYQLPLFYRNNQGEYVSSGKNEEF